MRAEHTREDDGSIKICLSKGHLRVCGWAASWADIEGVERLLARLLFDHEPLEGSRTV